MIRLLWIVPSFHLCLWYNATAIHHQHKRPDASSLLARCCLNGFYSKLIAVNRELPFQRTLVVFVRWYHFGQVYNAPLFLCLTWSQLHIWRNRSAHPNRRFRGSAIYVNTNHPKIILKLTGSSSFGTTLYDSSIVQLCLILLQNTILLLLISLLLGWCSL